MAERLRSKTSALARVELLLWIAGALCLGACALTGVRAVAAREQAEAFGRQAGSVPRAHEAPEGKRTPPDSLRQSVPLAPVDGRAKAGAGVVIGRLEIPQISLSVPVMADYDPNSLLRGVGHIQGTATPGGLGTMGLAGHRDTYFRPLRRIAAKMEIRVADETGMYHYEVDSTEVVTPEQVEVLEIRSRPELTLVTCFPFDYIGAAPKRFIVHAHLLSASPDADSSPDAKK